jgi:hypothetical protein
MMGIKQIAYVVLAIAVISAVGVAYSRVYKAGYTAAVVEIQEEAIRRQNEAAEAMRMAQDLGIAAAEIGLQHEDEVIEGIRDVEKQISEVVTACDDLGPDFLRVYNAAASASNRAAVDRPEPATEPD